MPSTVARTFCCFSNRLFDVAILLFISSIFVYLRRFSTPFERGIFCTDVSIRYPYRENTVTESMLIITTIGGPIIMIIVCEILRAAAKRAKCLETAHYSEKYDLHCWRFPAAVAQSYKYIGFFGFGVAVNAALTFIFKYKVGALRPYFLAVCKPNMTSLCSGSLVEYVDPVICTGNPADVIEARQSFLSGHSSMAFYAAAFLVIYLQGRFKIDFLSRLLVPFMQLLLVIFALFTALSRVSDYKHHSSDVIAGGLLGIVIAAAVLIPRADVFNAKSDEDDDDECAQSIVYRRGI
uniref:Phosphatidic acid phosphatase type 2/haloperoxidase domain-containing protein n=2 Tax=Plectus sambesii TaxID=2011161 RepID=A0A914V0N9_9BILA